MMRRKDLSMSREQRFYAATIFIRVFVEETDSEEVAISRTIELLRDINSDPEYNDRMVLLYNPDMLRIPQ